MKRIVVLLLMTAMAALMMTSCKENLPARFDRLVNYVEKHCDKFSQSDWDKANSQFSKLVDEYTENRNAYNADQRKQINSAIAKYAGLVAKSGVKSAMDVVNDLLEQIPSFFESIGNFLKDLGTENEE
ncbi:MAG: hypothetical protein IKH24_07510 [Bacteroidales bacterium]|jgi:hypothetical protein|nr:hypothetical protein [Bacteroidales bacterium]MBQ6300092.1 hypothetical protein [Bacteroidales bacterium]MBR0298752.1 hypothetical protein [Bacteroidales bacterium]MBR3450668.1 hypothetical protein [Bacteroidales bacterium]